MPKAKDPADITIRKLREVLTDMLYESERTMMDNHYHTAEWPMPQRLFRKLAVSIEASGFETDLDLAKRAREVLGLRWWGNLEWKDGLQPGK